MERTFVAIAGAIAAFVLMLVASAAHADDDSDRQDAGYSIDGRTYQESLDGPLFPDDVSWAPGDLRVSRFWVRPGSESKGDLTIQLDDSAVDKLVDSGDLKILARVGDLSWHPVRPGKAVVLSQSPARDGVPVSVRVSLADSASKDVRVNAADVALTVKLGDRRVVGAIVDTNDPMAAGPGEAATWWVVPMGLILLSGGALLYGRREIAGELR